MSSRPTSPNRDYPVWLSGLSVAFALAALTFALTRPDHTTTPTACQHAAAEAAAVISHNQRLAGLIDYIEGPATHQIEIGDNLARFDHRTPDLARCR